jgi:hypothetical protein
MKNNKYFLTMICAFFISMANFGCGKSTDQPQSQASNKNWPVVPRTILTECSECPIGCCCCGIENVSPTMYTLNVCGLCEGDYHCGPFSPGSPCSTFSGLGKDISFSGTHVREIFCIEPGASFRISNPQNFTVYFKFSCQYDQVGYTFTNVSIGPFGEKFFHNDGDCIEEGCG